MLGNAHHWGHVSSRGLPPCFTEMPLGAARVLRVVLLKAASEMIRCLTPSICSLVAGMSCVHVCACLHVCVCLPACVCVPACMRVVSPQLLVRMCCSMCEFVYPQSCFSPTDRLTHTMD